MAILLALETNTYSNFNVPRSRIVDDTFTNGFPNLWTGNIGGTANNITPCDMANPSLQIHRLDTIVNDTVPTSSLLVPDDLNYEDLDAEAEVEYDNQFDDADAEDDGEEAEIEEHPINDVHITSKSGLLSGNLNRAENLPELFGS